MKTKSFTRLMSGLLLVTILITFILTAGITNYYIRKNLVDNAIENGQRNVTADSTSLGIYLSHLRRSSMELYYNNSVYTVLYETEHSYSDSTTIFSFLQSAVNLSDGGEISQIYINLYRSGKSYLVGGTGRISGDGNWKVEMPEGLDRYHVYCEGPHAGHTYGMELDDSEAVQVCTFHWNIYSTMGDQIIGTISFDVRLDKLVGYMASVENGNPVYLLDGEGNIIYANTDLLTAERRQELLLKSAVSDWVEVDDSTFSGFAFIEPVDNDMIDWQIVELKTNEQLFRTADQILKWQIVIMVLACLICAAAAVYLIVRLTQPIRDLKNYVQIVEKGDLTVNIRDYTDYSRPDEIGMLIEHLENMMNTVNDMFVRQHNLSRAHRSVEMKMLLAQVNPHFIYNTLQSISTLALVHKEMDVYRLLVKLGAQMQYSMNLEQEVVELQQEIRYTENYFDLQQQRFENRFVYEMKVEPGTEHITLPRMMLQPLAENAIKHGMIHRMPHGFIRIRIFREEDMLKIWLEDNGRGCPPERREELNRQLLLATEDEIRIQEHIGLLNVHYRLKLLYGEKVSMRIEPSRWGGALVMVQIPLDQYEGGPKYEGIDRR